MPNWGDGSKWGGVGLTYGYEMGVSPSIHTGTGTASIVACDQILVIITGTGGVGVGTFKYRYKNSAQNVYQESLSAAIPATFTFPRSDIDATLSNLRMSFSGTFTNGDIYTFKVGCFKPVLTGVGTGTITLSTINLAQYFYHQFLATVTGNGAPGTGTWNYSCDGRSTVSVGAAKMAMLPGVAAGNKDEFPAIAVSSGLLANGDTFTFSVNYLIQKIGNAFLGLDASMKQITGAGIGALHLHNEIASAHEVKVIITADGAAGACNWEIYLDGVLQSSRTVYNSYSLAIDSYGSYVNVSLVNNWNAVKTYKTGDTYIYRLTPAA